MNIELKITIVTALITGMKWVYEYTKQRKWERNRYLIERLDLFKSKDSVKKMQLMLDWNNITIQIDGKDKKVTDDILYEALITHNKKSTFTSLEFDLRLIFDEYFDSLNELIILTKTGLIDKNELNVYMEYWFDTLKGKRKNKSLKLINQIHEYLEYYGYEDLYHYLNFEI